VLAVTPFSTRQMKATIDHLMPVPKDDCDHTKLEAERGKGIRLFDTAVGIERVRGTAWAAFQGWSEFADHHRQVRDSGREDPRRARLASIWMGRAADIKQAALVRHRRRGPARARRGVAVRLPRSSDSTFGRPAGTEEPCSQSRSC
jgi:hypothetical protein